MKKYINKIVIFSLLPLAIISCDKDELNLAIQACIEIGDFSNMNLR